MKKILSFILALTLCIGLLPTFASAANAEGFTVDFSVFNSLKNSGTDAKPQYWLGTGSKYNKSASGNGWQSVEDTKICTILNVASAVIRFFPSSYMQMNYTSAGNGVGNNVFAADITMPNSGIYDISANLGYVNYAGAIEIQIDDKTIGSKVDLYTDSASLTMQDVLVESGVYLSKGTHRIKVVGRNSSKNTGDGQTIYLKNFVFTPSEDAFIVDFTTVDTSTLTDGYKLSRGGVAAGLGWSAETRYTVSSLLTGSGYVRFNSDHIQLYAYNNTIADRNTMVFYIDVPETAVYDISMDAGYLNSLGIFDIELGGRKIASGLDFYRETETAEFEKIDLEQGVYLRKGANTLKIIAKGQPKTGDSGSANGLFKNFTFVKSSKPVILPEDAKVNFAETTNVAGFGGITVSSVNRGESVELTAHKQEIPGYKFVGWKRGADTSDESAWVEIDGDSYNVWTNTFLTAVYEKETGKAVEFWNQNGAYIGNMDEETYNAQEKLFTPTLTGFDTFIGWFTENDTEFTAGMTLEEGTTNAVAQYEASAVSGVKRDGILISDADTYDEEIEFTKNNDSSTCWKRDGNIVSYDDTYTYYVWDATNVTEDTDVIADKVPVGILEYSADHGAYMLEYDDGDYEIVEAGIIFGNGSQTVDSCDKKFTSQKKVSHNQFTAPEQSGKTALGYIIWKDSFGVYNIDYIK